MKNNLTQEITISLILIVLLIFFLNPFKFWMPTVLLMFMILGLLVAFCIFASFIWREKPRDEREDLHKMIAGRIAFLVGAATLVAGIIIQSLFHQLDYWLVLTLSIMILAKIAGLFYGQMRN